VLRHSRRPLILLWAPTASAVVWNVTIADFSFTPRNLTISAGNSVWWTNTGDFLHTTTAATTPCS